MAFTPADTGPYLVVLGMKNATYRVKDAWARAEIEEIEKAIEGGTHFRGVLTPNVAGNTITDGETVKNLTVGAAPGTLITAADQKAGDMFIYYNGTQNLEFIVANGKYSELGSSGKLGAFAYVDTGTVSFSVPIQSAISFNDFTPQVTKGTLAASPTKETLVIGTTQATASGTFSPAKITVPGSNVTLTPTTDTFTALTTATYDANTATLTISDGTSPAFWKSATGSTAAQEVTPPADQSISVTYDKASAGSTQVVTDVTLTGDISVTASKPSATITDPTVTATVNPTT